MRNVKVEGDKIKENSCIYHSMSEGNKSIVDFSSSYKYHLNKRWSVNIHLEQNCILCCYEGLGTSSRFSCAFFEEVEINLFVVAFHGLDPSLGTKIEWFVLFYAIECFSLRQENDTFPTYILKIFSDSFQNHLSSVQYLHCVFIWPYFWPSFIFTFFFFNNSTNRFSWDILHFFLYLKMYEVDFCFQEQSFC